MLILERPPGTFTTLVLMETYLLIYEIISISTILQGFFDAQWTEPGNAA